MIFLAFTPIHPKFTPFHPSLIKITDGTLNYETLKGMTGSVYISIPGNLQRGGQVTIAHPSQLLYLPAVQEGEHPLPSGTPVEVVAVTAGIVTVKPLH